MNPEHVKLVKRLVGHSPGCCFVDEEQPDQFLVQGGTVYRDAAGRKGRETWAWNTYLCTDPKCVGTVGVRSDALGEFIAEALASSPYKTLFLS